MNSKLLTLEVQKFISDYDADLTELAFSGSPFKNITVQELIIQIESRRKAKNKLPTWFKTTSILYPPKLNLEQTSSEQTAAYKASLINSKKTIDITGGFGIDTYYLCKFHDQVVHVEHNETLAELVKHNAEIFNIKNLKIEIGDGIKFLKNEKFDLIYVDPSRRNNIKGKVFLLNDCEPNVPKLLPTLFKHSNKILIKTSPMLDIQVGLKELVNVQEIHIVAINNEVKELLWILDKEVTQQLKTITVNFLKKQSEFFNFKPDIESKATFSHPQQFLYEPNTAILKSGGFQVISEKLNLNKLHLHSHLYTKDTLIDFPGRRFKIEKQVPYNKTEMRSGITFDKANITTRNFPETVQQLRKKWKIKDGGSIYLFFTTVKNDKKMMLICSKITI